MVLYILLTGYYVFPLYYANLAVEGGATPLIGFAFPPLMGIALAMRLRGKYWLGFGWAAFCCYFLSSLFLLFGADVASSSSVFQILVASFLMFACQSNLLYLRKRT